MNGQMIYDTSIGRLLFMEENGHLTRLTTIPPDFSLERQQETPLLLEALSQLNEYLQGIRKNFDLPLKLEGTPFQRQVWAALSHIPYGETRSYKNIAESIQNPKAVRAVGMANNRNPIFIIIPCHRVIGANGSLVGYGGGLELKARLLELEAQKNG